MTDMDTVEEAIKYFQREKHIFSIRHFSGILIKEIATLTKDLEAWKEQAHFEAIKAVERITLLKQQLEESKEKVEELEKYIEDHQYDGLGEEL